MGNAGSSTAHMHRERHKSTDLSTPSSPAHFRDSVGGGGAGSAGPTSGGAAALGGIGAGGQAFSFDKKHTAVLNEGSSQDDENPQPYYTGAKRTADNDAVTAEGGSTTAVLQSAVSGENTMDDFNNDEQTGGSAAALTGDDDELKKTALPTVLRWDGGGKNVTISGTFSQWKPIPMVRSHGNFVTIIDLPEGDHQYKFCVDGEWKHDPKLKSVENEDGIKNNLVSVRASDFEVFQALAKDSENVPNYAEKEYSQEVPQVKPWEKVSGPPVLPPHLLQVILNKDTPLSCEPTLLPEPNHVMLNHLYALSIKDGVMVLSATHRYRKKYVTTLLYKPI
ncbi:5'-AMP-activated protein kinase subunit beta-1 [Scaptodrosophila lebanonensis]|uniref:5'-AMP-activated protein kinase subunit beta-1 n=1 Tax=Drosophila lebanonensis TaxID=7225 RepID=A0A6J2T973_DROLE|nr:5'-AMP-activated protein kinase subunit beta-1 [Scaptodrosophila lebanonensis]